MERERWTQLCGAIRRVDASFQDSPRYTHRTAVIVKVYLYAAARDRPVSWACDRHNWDERDGPPPQLLPDQSTMSRRTRGARFDQFLREMDTRLAGPRGPGLVKRIDGKSLAVAAHSSDRDATWGRGPGQDCRGYKLHAVWAAGRAMPEQWAVTPLNVDERTVARRLVKRLEGTCGYLLADGLYEGDPLCRLCAAADHQLVANRRRPGSGIGHHPCGAARRDDDASTCSSRRRTSTPSARRCTANATRSTAASATSPASAAGWHRCRHGCVASGGCVPGSTPNC